MAEGAPQSIHPTATYKEQLIRAYRGNRFIEALPEITDPEADAAAMQRIVGVSDDERAAPGWVRAHMLETFTASFLQPLTQHVELAGRFSTMLRAGYLSRNPDSPTFMAALGRTLEEIRSTQADRGKTRKYSRASGRGMAVVGMSGLGKSRAVEAVLDLYPQVIFHPELSGPLRSTHQVVWLKVSCPTDGSIKAVCRRFFAIMDQLLGTTYASHYAPNTTIEKLRDGMCSVAYVHGLGCLVIDEVQNLRRATNFNADAMLRFFLLLRDDLNVPVVVIGTETAIGVLGGTMQVARRHAGTPLFDRMAFHDGTFELFCRGMFSGQYLRETIEPTPDILGLLYELSQGVTDVLLKVFVLAQWRALSLGVELLSAELFTEVYDDCLGLLHPWMALIKSGKAFDEAGFDDAIEQTGLDLLEERASTPSDHTARELATMRPKRAPAPKAGPPPTAEAAVPTVKRRRAKRRGTGIVAVVQARETGTSAHEALRRSGYVREVGAEVAAEYASEPEPC